MSNFKQLGLAFHQYWADYDSKQVPYNTHGIKTGNMGFWFGTTSTATPTDAGASSSDPRPGYIIWADSPLAPYNPTYELVNCAEAPNASDPRNQYEFSKRLPGFGYGANINVLGGTAAYIAFLPGIENPAETVMLGDAGWYNYGEARNTLYLRPPPYSKTAPSSGQDAGLWDDDGIWENQSGGVRGHSNGFANFLWMDGHASAKKVTLRNSFNPNNPHAAKGLGDLVHPSFSYATRTTTFESEANRSSASANVNSNGTRRVVTDYYFLRAKPPLPQ